ncbi:MAG TPA: TlpA disulfide reductase family protein, partial [Thermomicrobiales bacterium]|nr:TlpA disulfide reductase family protein [Thermomicrobiales bacterium]
LVAAVVAAGIAWASQSDDRAAPRMAPDFSVQLMSSTSAWKLSNERGRVVVLNFWATWCDPCKREAPSLNEVATEMSDEGVAFIGIAPKSDNSSHIRSFVNSYGLTYSIGQDSMGGDRLDGSITLNYGVYGYPTTVFIAPDGLISAVDIQPLSADEIENQIARAKNA